MAVQGTFQDDKVIRDPVCGMVLDPVQDELALDHDGRHYHFCAERCRERFLDDPEPFIQA